MITILIRDLPPKVRALTVRVEEGVYTVILNARLPFEMQQKSYLHELRHIERGDFDGGDINEIEARNG